MAVCPFLIEHLPLSTNCMRMMSWLIEDLLKLLLVILERKTSSPLELFLTRML